MIHSLPLDLSLERLRALFAYQPESPMLFSTGLFFFLFIAFYIGYRALRHTTTARILYVVLFSLYFYYKSSGVWFLLLVFTATSDFLIARALAATVRPAGRKVWVALSLVINLGMLAYFKYTNFLLQTLLAIGQSMGSWFGVAPVGGTVYEPLDIFLPVGISFPSSDAGASGSASFTEKSCMVSFFPIPSTAKVRLQVSGLSVPVKTA